MGELIKVLLILWLYCLPKPSSFITERRSKKGSRFSKARETQRFFARPKKLCKKGLYHILEKVWRKVLHQAFPFRGGVSER